MEDKYKIISTSPTELIALELPEEIKHMWNDPFRMPSHHEVIDDRLKQAIESGIPFHPSEVEKVKRKIWETEHPNFKDSFPISWKSDWTMERNKPYPVPENFLIEISCKWRGNRVACANEYCWDLNECQGNPTFAFLKPKEQSFNHLISFALEIIGAFAIGWFIAWLYENIKKL